MCFNVCTKNQMIFNLLKQFNHRYMHNLTKTYLFNVFVLKTFEISFKPQKPKVYSICLSGNKIFYNISE